MTAWASNEPTKIEPRDGLRDAGLRADGTRATPRTIWRPAPGRARKHPPPSAAVVERA